MVPYGDLNPTHSVEEMARGIIYIIITYQVETASWLLCRFSPVFLGCWLHVALAEKGGHCPSDYGQSAQAGHQVCSTCPVLGTSLESEAPLRLQSCECSYQSRYAQCSKEIGSHKICVLYRLVWCIKWKNQETLIFETPQTHGVKR